MTTIRNEPSVFTTIVERGKPSTHGRGRLCMKKRRSAPQKPASAKTKKNWPLLDASHCAKTFKNRDCEEPLHALWPRELWLQELGLQERCPRAVWSLCPCIDIFVFASPLEPFTGFRWFSAAFPCVFTPTFAGTQGTAPDAITYSLSFLFRIVRFLAKSR